MGQHDVRSDLPGVALRDFQRALLDDLDTLDAMQQRGLFETGVRRIGAEQEMFLVDRAGGPALLALEALRAIDDPRLTTELALFNLEANLTPIGFAGACLRALEDELVELVATTRAAANELDADVVLAGILPTLRESDLDLDRMTPVPRYRALADTLRSMRGEEFRIHIKGIEELDLVHDNVMLEACTTSFQLHWQVAPEEFVGAYNIAQLIAAPVLAAATNSPLLLGRRLWQETRVALFQQSTDSRATAVRARSVPPRVSFGEHWVRESVTELFRENIERHRVLVLGPEPPASSSAQLARGEIPTLDALRLHNGTIYRWNRPCYGIGEGKPHLRIEARQLPSGPTILDEVGNAALHFGLLSEGALRWHDVAARMPFDRAKDNFFAAARLGLHAPITWIDGTTRPAGELLLHELLPAAASGLARAGIDEADADRYLGIVRARIESARTGADWMLASLERMGAGATLDRRLRALVRAMLDNQRSGQPLATWSLAPAPADDQPARDYRTVDQFMSTDLHTLRPEDAVDLAAALMHWEHVRHVPVEDDAGRLVGLVALVDLLRRLAPADGRSVAVRDVMDPAPIRIAADTTLLEAMALMRAHAATALPVVQDDRLVGLVTERDLLRAAEQILRSRADGGGG